jgi:hypothetical protein
LYIAFATQLRPDASLKPLQDWEHCSIETTSAASLNAIARAKSTAGNHPMQAECALETAQEAEAENCQLLKGTLPGAAEPSKFNAIARAKSTAGNHPMQAECALETAQEAEAENCQLLKGTLPGAAEPSKFNAIAGQGALQEITPCRL